MDRVSILLNDRCEFRWRVVEPAAIHWRPLYHEGAKITRSTFGVRGTSRPSCLRDFVVAFKLRRRQDHLTDVRAFLHEAVRIGGALEGKRPGAGLPPSRASARSALALSAFARSALCAAGAGTFAGYFVVLTMEVSVLLLLVVAAGGGSHDGRRRADDTANSERAARTVSGLGCLRDARDRMAAPQPCCPRAAATSSS
jgi:hypothetical protein